MTILEIQEQYALEKERLLKEYQSKSITKASYDDFLAQLNRAEHMDIVDAMLEEEA